MCFRDLLRRFLDLKAPRKLLMQAAFDCEHSKPYSRIFWGEYLRCQLRSVSESDAYDSLILGASLSVTGFLRSGMSGMAEAFEKDRKLFSSQTYEIRNHVVNGERVAVEVLWIGNLAAGSEIRAHSAMFFEFKDGKVVSQQNYDCFEPW